MIPAELIKRKRDGLPLPREDLKRFIQGYVNGTVTDYQMAALLMAVYFKGMTDDELFSLVEIMLNSGERMDFSHLDSYVADKHSTGGVGDKISIILGPLLAAAGLAIPMISGRSLGHTGGTLDKLETIPGFQVDVSLAEFRRLVETVGIAMIGQTGEICPADKKMYALRDVTGTVESIPLICGSIMSKKIAEGIHGLVLDVKVGNGAFMKNYRDAQRLGTLLQRVGRAFNVTTDVVYTSMSQPLGRTAGLWCEVNEAIETLKGDGPEDVLTVTFELGARLLMQAGKGSTRDEVIDLQKELIRSGKAYETFLNMVAAQNGRPDEVEHHDSLHRPRYKTAVKADRTGTITGMDTYHIGLATVELGSGRKKTTDRLDPTAGIEFLHKIGDEVRTGDVLFYCFNSDQQKLQSALHILEETVTIEDSPANHRLILSEA